MSGMRIACPRCQTVLKSPRALPVGLPLRCGKCTARFRVPQRVIPTPPAGTRLACPACRAVLRFPGPVPPGRSIRCAKCATVFRRDRPQSLMARAAQPKPPPPRPRTTQIGRPVTFLTCGSCQARMKINGHIRPGLAIPCPRCRKRLPLPPTQRRTRLAPRARPTTLAPPPQRTRLAPKAPAKKTQLTPAARRRVRFPCPACRAVMALPGPVPLNRPIRCPRCKKVFRFQKKSAAGSKSRSAPPAQRPARPAPRPTPPKPRPAQGTPRPASPRRPSRRWLKPAAALALLVALGAATIWLLLGLRSYDIPAEEWREFAPAGGACRVLLPGEPTEDEVPQAPGQPRMVKFTVIRELDTHGLTGVRTGKIAKAFILQYADWPQSGPRTFAERYQSQRDLVARGAQGEMVSEQEVTVDGRPGREFVIRSGAGEDVIGRFIQVNDRTYLLLAGGAYLEPGRGDSARFFESFRLQD